MNVITVSREYGAGGGAAAQQLARLLGWELLDRELLGPAASEPAQYDLVANAGRLPLDDVVATVREVVRGESAEPPGDGPRVLTLARELGAGDTGFGPTLGGRLALRVYDRELLEQEAV